MSLSDRLQGRVGLHSSQLHEGIQCNFPYKDAIDQVEALMRTKFGRLHTSPEDRNRIKSFLLVRSLDALPCFERIRDHYRIELNGAENGVIIRQVRGRKLEIYLVMKELEILFLLH